MIKATWRSGQEQIFDTSWMNDEQKVNLVEDLVSILVSPHPIITKIEVI